MRRFFPARWAAAAAVALITATVGGAELKFDLESSLDRAPTGFASGVTGPGSPGEWKVIESQVTPSLTPLSPEAHPVAQQAVLSVKSLDLTDTRFAVLLYTNGDYQDFTFTARLKILGGAAEPSAGLIFRAQNASNYYVLRAGTAGYLLWHRVVNGKSIEALGVGVRTPIARNQWEEIKVECKGSAIRCYLDGKLLIPPGKPGAPTDNLAVNDSTFASGQIGFWAKADTEARFTEARLHYSPRIPFMQTVAAAVLQVYPRIVGLDIYATRHGPQPVVIASKDTNHLGQAGSKVEDDVIRTGTVYYAKGNGWVEMTLPLHDRNGETVAALKTRLERFPGETQETALARATTIRREIEAHFNTLEDVTE